MRLEGIQYVLEDLFQMGNIDARLQIGDGTANIGRNEVQDLLGHGGESPNAQIGSRHNDRRVHGAQQVDQVVVYLSNLRVAALHFRVNRVQFLVGGLQFLLRGLHFLVRALQLLVGRLGLLVGRTKLFDNRLQILASTLQFLPKLGVFLSKRQQ